MFITARGIRAGLRIAKHCALGFPHGYRFNIDARRARAPAEKPTYDSSPDFDAYCDR